MCGACEPTIYAKSEKDISPVWLKDARSWHPAIDVTKLKHLYISMMMCCIKCEEIIVENMEEVCGVFGAHAEWQKGLLCVVLSTTDDPCNKYRKRVLRVARKIDKNAMFVDPPKPPPPAPPTPPPPAGPPGPPGPRGPPGPPGPPGPTHAKGKCECVCCNAANWIMPREMWPPNAHAPVCHQPCTALCYDNWYPAKPCTDEGYSTVLHYPRHGGCFFCISLPFTFSCSCCGRTGC